MASVSIGAQNQNDASYRYKMPKLIAKVEGRGNGIKTVIVNMVDIAKALHVEPAYPTKYFGIELGAQSKFDRSTERAVVNGRHDQPDLATLLDKFIQTFVLCPNCHLPEISMHVGKNNIKIDCAACGHNAPLATNHKLTTYIIKNPPADNGKKSKSADASGKGKKKKEPKDGDAEEEPEEETTEDAPAEEKKVAVVVSEKDIEWFTDTSDEAAQKRKEAEFEEMVKAKANAKSANPEAAALASIKDLHKEPPEVVLRLFLSQQKREVNEVVSELRRLQLARGLDDTQKIQVLLRAIINAEEVKKVPKQFSSHARLLKQFAKDRPASLQLIGCIEEYVGVQEKALLKYVAHIFKALYEADVLEEEVLVSWYESPPESSWLVQRDVAVNIRKKAKPFIEWLRNAEEESEEED